VKRLAITFEEITAMKKIFLSLSLVAGLFAGAQMKEGKVVYERTIQFQRRNMDPAMAEMMPQSRKDNFELLFGNNQVLWQSIQTAEGDNGTVSAPGMVFRMQGANDVVYVNLDTKKRLDQREMFDRQFLVEDSIHSLGWKLSDETKTLLGHPVRKAVAQRISTRMQTVVENGQMKRQEMPDTAQVTAWFATDIPVSAGPAEFQGQLPGLILEFSMNNGRTVYNAVEISPKVKLSDIKEPKKGKRVTEAEYVQERNSLMDEMRKNMPAGRTMRINSN
jgi:GLPGLI family protein